MLKTSLMTSFTLLLSKKLFLPLKKTYQLLLLTLNSQKLLLGETPYLRDTMPRHWSSSDFQRESYGFERVVFTLRRFLPYTPSCYFQSLPGAGGLTLILAEFHVDIFKTQPRPDYLFDSQQSTIKIHLVTSIYMLRISSY